MSELPQVTCARLRSVGLTEQEAEVLMILDAGRDVRFDGEPALGALQYFDCLVQGRSAKAAVSYVWVQAPYSALRSEIGSG